MSTILSAETQALLASSPLLSGVSSELIKEALESSLTVKLSKGDILLRPGQISEHVYIITRGRMRIQSNESDLNPIAMYGEGDSIAEVSILGDGQSPAYVIAATDCELITIEHASLWALIERSHKTSLNILHLLSQRIQISEQVITESFEQHHGFQGVEMVDKVTGLYNQLWMSKELERYLQRCERENRYSCLLILEIDGFKEYIASYGELGGDQALRTFAHTVVSTQRPEDQAGHYLDTKFSIFIPYTTTVEAACIFAERLSTAISNADIVLPSGDTLPHISVSIGVCQRQEDGLQGLLARGESALQEALNAGGNCVRSVA